MAESWEMTGRERRYSVPAIAQLQSSSTPMAYGDNGSRANTAEDLHAWSIYRQNLNSDFADSALGSSMKAPLPYGNFQLDSTTSTVVEFYRLFSFLSFLLVLVTVEQFFSHLLDTSSATLLLFRSSRLQLSRKNQKFDQVYSRLRNLKVNSTLRLVNGRLNG